MSTPDPIPFDTLRFVKRMTGAGMPLAQAEALAEEQRVLMDAHFATRRDTDEFKLGLPEVKRDIEELKLGLAVVKAELTMVKWIVSGVGFGMLLLLIRTFWPV